MTKLEKYVKERQANRKSTIAELLKGKTIEVYNHNGFTQIIDLDERFMAIFDARDEWDQIILFSALMSVIEVNEEEDTISSFEQQIKEMCQNQLFQSEWEAAENGAESFAAIKKYDNANGNIIMRSYFEAEVFDDGDWDLPDLGEFYGLMHTVNEELLRLGREKHE